jgi:hypothetical protein
LEKYGVETDGIGINSDAVEHFYKNSIVLRDVTQLPHQVMNELKRILS